MVSPVNRVRRLALPDLMGVSLTQKSYASRGRVPSLCATRCRLNVILSLNLLTVIRGPFPTFPVTYLLEYQVQVVVDPVPVPVQCVVDAHAMTVQHP